MCYVKVVRKLPILYKILSGSSMLYSSEDSKTDQKHIDVQEKKINAVENL